jgi:hypothetical protein
MNNGFIPTRIFFPIYSLVWVGGCSSSLRQLLHAFSQWFASIRSINPALITVITNAHDLLILWTCQLLYIRVHLFSVLGGAYTMHQLSSGKIHVHIFTFNKPDIIPLVIKWRCLS